MKDNKKTLVKGLNNSHILYGNFLFIEEENSVEVIQDCLLKHQDSVNIQADHHTLKVPVGVYEIARAVEYNPMSQTIEEIFD